MKRINVSTKVMPSDSEEQGFEAIEGYATLEEGSNRVAMAIRNVTHCKLTLKKGMVVATVMAANAIPPMLAPHPGTFSSIPEYATPEANSGPIPECMGTYSCRPHEKPELTDQCSDQLFHQLDLSLIEMWPEADQQRAIDLLKEYHHLFALDDLELGCTSQVKHKIKVMDLVPFKQRYRCIPPHQFQEVKKHLEEMLSMEAICKSISPWASLVMLIRKKDGSL